MGRYDQYSYGFAGWIIRRREHFMTAFILPFFACF
ncbi:hypothetical protein HCH_02317 [Hahella chejuensis KCTC 2396]|uniref:Uncharacterized protein n=1 Tax=Hahella chejuensis (strain KCTC 2396) TaxID=349521 RepID=Q2SJN4_HAHCH|nr:hypothetical protein HCH_02317 [Hahella chejuensis KCTC 2396]